MSNIKVPGFALRKPCAACPFRADRPFYLRPERAREFADDLAGGGSFHCHKTVDFGDPEQDEPVQMLRDTTQWCAGALITLEKSGISNQQVRIAERLGVYDPAQLDMDAPVYPSLSAWVASYRDEDQVRTVEVDGQILEFEHCGVVGADCEDPAGYMSGGGAMENTDPGTCHPVEDNCQQCGANCCTACTASVDEHGAKTCVYCAEAEEYG